MRFPRPTAFVLFLLVLAAPAWAGELRAGFAKKEITPNKPVPLGGYSARKGKPSEGVHDPIYARALVLDDGESRLALVVLDLIGIDRRCREAVLRALKGKVDLRADQLMMSATHTHSGSGGLARDVHWWIAMGVYDDKLFRETAAATAQAVLDAFAALRPARLGVKLDTLDGFNRNRRVDNGPRDTDFTLLRVDGADGAPMGVLVNYAAHPTILGSDDMLVSADFPGALCRELEQRHGEAFTAIFTNGDEGDMSPNTPGGETQWDRVEAMGRALADEVDKRLPAIQTNSRVLLRAGTRKIRLPTPKIPLIFPGDVLIGYWQVQDAIFLAVPGEMCVDVGVGVKGAVKGLGQASTTIIGLANDHLGYFTSPEGLKRGGYEADMNFYGPDIGATFERGFRALVTFEDPWGM